MIYVLSNNGSPLMPCTECKAKKLLKSDKAYIKYRIPFTIQLNFECENKVQNVTLGLDTGSKHIGASATTDRNVLYESDTVLRNDIVDLLSTRRQNRRSRRSRKTRYRISRFLNRVKSKNKGWLAPSVENKIQSHFRVVSNICRILPINRIVVETASFDIQKINNPDIHGKEYQEGSQLGFWNTREYVLCRDGHICQSCKGKSKDKILNVHHIESRKTGGDSPNNLITLCETCHKAYHNGTLKLNLRRGSSFRDASFMGIMRWTFYNRLRETYPNVSMTFGYITKNTRITHNLPKEHYIDARCISGNADAVSDGSYFFCKKIRCHNRQIHKNTILKGGYRKRNQAEYTVFGFRLFDRVKYNGQKCFIFGRRSSGSFDIRTLDGTKISAGISYKKLKFLGERNSILIEERSLRGFDSSHG